ncbi:hypothetical protein LPJ72_005462, partial [Coemansia sp. Benny D160-2]
MDDDGIRLSRIWSGVRPESTHTDTDTEAETCRQGVERAAYSSGDEEGNDDNDESSASFVGSYNAGESAVAMRRIRSSQEMLIDRTDDADVDVITGWL